MSRNRIDIILYLTLIGLSLNLHAQIDWNDRGNNFTLDGTKVTVNSYSWNNHILTSSNPIYRGTQGDLILTFDPTFTKFYVWVTDYEPFSIKGYNLNGSSNTVDQYLFQVSINGDVNANNCYMNGPGFSLSCNQGNRLDYLGNDIEMRLRFSDNEILFLVDGVNRGAYLLNGEREFYISAELREAAGISFNADFEPVQNTESEWLSSNLKDVFYSQGNVGIGNINPLYPLDVSGDIATKNLILNSNDLGAGSIEFGTSNSNQWSIDNSSGLFSFKANGSRAMQFDEEGNLGIGGYLDANHKLTVNGSLKAAEIHLDPNLWPDYVFEEDYNLMSLPELQRYIDQKRHLPNVPSEKEVKENGIELGAMNIKLLEKIEELTLYMIDLQEQVDRNQEKVNLNREILENLK